MLSPIFRAAIILAIMIVFFIQDVIFMRRYDHERKGGGSGRGWKYDVFIIAFGVLIVLQPIFVPRLGLSTSRLWGLVIQVLGVLLVAFGITLHIWARMHIRQFYTEYIELQPDHYVVETGPYAHIRHPIFMSSYGIAIGIFMINPAIITALVAIYAFWDFTGSARKEEELLSEALPEYVAYMTRTPRYLPRLSDR
jgi:protein-S-isoprenylcysteine O-methyltransferase Ste14